MFSRIFIERPRLAAVVSLILLLAGGISLANLPVAEYPEIAPPTLFVSATYSGASADVVAQTVAMPLENEINGVEDLLYFSSTSSNSGSYSCSVTFRSGTDSDIALVNLQNAVKRAEAQLPSEVTKVGITVEKRGNDILAMLAFQTDGTSLSLNELVNYVNNNVKDALARLEGVSSSDMMSQQEYAMRIWMDPLRMSGLGISSSEIRSAVEAQNVQAAAGTLGAEGSNRYVSYKLNVQGRLKTAEEFGEIVVRSDADSGRIVRLRDVATVELGSSSYAGSSTFNGKESVGLSLYRSPDANALATMNRIKAELATWEQRFPPGVSYSIAYDPTKFIVASMREMVSTLVVALVLVVLVTWLFIQDWRATLIPAVAIPVSLVGTFSVMYALGYSINTLTMFGLILVIGSLVDDAIVVVENTQGIMEREGLSAREAAIKSMRQITGAVIATTLVTVACYAPLAFYGGMVGAIYRQFAVSMCVALCLSTVVALTLSPALCALVLRRPARQQVPGRPARPLSGHDGASCPARRADAGHTGRDLPRRMAPVRAYPAVVSAHGRQGRHLLQCGIARRCRPGAYRCGAGHGARASVGHPRHPFRHAGLGHEHAQRQRGECGHVHRGAGSLGGAHRAADPSFGHHGTDPGPDARYRRRQHRGLHPTGYHGPGRHGRGLVRHLRHRRHRSLRAGHRHGFLCP